MLNRTGYGLLKTCAATLAALLGLAPARPVKRAYSRWQSGLRQAQPFPAPRAIRDGCIPTASQGEARQASPEGPAKRDRAARLAP